MIEGEPLLGPPYHGRVVRYCRESDLPSYMAFAPYPKVRMEAVVMGWITEEEFIEDWVRFQNERPERERRIAELCKEHERYRKAGRLRKRWLRLICRDGLASV
jgi:hypothetical protein